MSFSVVVYETEARMRSGTSVVEESNGVDVAGTILNSNPSFHMVAWRVLASTFSQEKVTIPQVVVSL